MAFNEANQATRFQLSFVSPETGAILDWLSEFYCVFTRIYRREYSTIQAVGNYITVQTDRHLDSLSHLNGCLQILDATHELPIQSTKAL